jgi:hypothetical protein
MSVCPYGTNQLPLDRFSWNLIFEYFSKICREIKCHENLTRITGTLHEHTCTFMIISRSVPLRVRNVSDKSCRQNQNTHFMFSEFSQKSCRLWDNVEKHGTARQATDVNIIQRMRFACWMTKAADTHSEYVILIAFPRQQWLRERALMLCLLPALLSVKLCYSRLWLTDWLTDCNLVS